MLSVLNNYAHGYVAAPVIVACRQQGLFDVLDHQRGVPLKEIVSKLDANKGALLIALNMLESMGWVDKSGDLYMLTDESRMQSQIPDDIVELLSFSMDEYVSKVLQHKCSLKRWINLSANQWNIDCEKTAMMLDGMLVIPLVLTLRDKAGIRSQDDVDSSFTKLPSGVKQEVLDFFSMQKWVKKAEDDESRLVFTDVGMFILDRISITSIVASYRPMLANIATVLFGDCRSVFQRDSEGNEMHIDRTLNVLGSGFQHGKYFNEMANAILPLFDADDYEAQPKYVADMGCGDGSLLKTIHEFIKTKTARGAVLDRYPVKMIGVDYNDKAIIESAKTLRGIDHIVLRGDIGDPTAMIKDLKRLGVEDPENVLHVRSFLDHDRPYIAPTEESLQQYMAIANDDAVFIDVDGNEIAEKDVYFSLVEHFQRWYSIMGKYGLIALEVHCLEPKTIRQYFDKSESLHFDTYHRFSQQLLMSAENYVMAAAHVGLFPVVGGHKKFPKGFPFSRITLNHFEKREYQIRPANPADLAIFDQLEDACWSSELRASLKTIEKRLARYPEGQLAVYLDGKVVGVIYSQRINDQKSLETATIDDVEALHDPEGNIMQLLAVNIFPEYQQQGLGDQLLEFMLQRCSLVNGIEKVMGVTLCKDYVNYSDLSLEEYITKTNQQGLSVDPTLRFHQIHGANIEKVVPGYRPKDVANGGDGVLISYDVRARERFDPIKARKAVRDEPSRNKGDIQIVVEKAVRQALGRSRESSFGMEFPLMEMGLDSADLLELQVQLSSEFGVALEPAFFFTHTTATRIVDYFAGETGQTARPQKDISNELAFVTASRQEEPVSDHDMAIIGISCRLPGDVNNLDQLWEMLANGEDAIESLPAGRWTWPAGIDPQNLHKGIDRGGYLAHIDEFDAKFFRISRKEAELMDPQQRILLELSWECIENAGYATSSLFGSDTGVFVGASGSDYNVLINKHVDEVEAHFGVGTALSVLPNRISYFYNLKGPSMQIDTACSSSLVSLHEAIKSVRNGECSQALVAGINIMCNPSNNISYYKAGMLANDGLCKVFDERANGYVRGEGGVMILIKPLAQAIKDNDDIYAVVKGTSVNHGGQASGLTVPNPDQQAALISAAYASSGVSLENVGYIEAHGTGTPLGDPIEVRGIKQAFSQRKAGQGSKCGLGSIKTNIGHLEAAAGLAGLLKLVVSLKHKQLPPSINFNKINPNISFSETPFEVVDTLRPWEVPQSGGRRCCSVSSFGSGGTNAHVVLEEAAYASPAAQQVRKPYLICLSAATQESLIRKMEELAAWLETDRDGAGLDQVMATLLIGRDHFAHRWAGIVNDRQELTEKLKSVIEQTVAGNNTSTSQESGVPDYPTAEEIDTGYLSTLGEIHKAYLTGEDVDWARLYDGGAVVRAHLPSYPFARESFWINEKLPAMGDAGRISNVVHPLVNEKTVTNTGYRFNSFLTGDEYLFNQHVIKEQFVLPGVAHLEMVRACMSAIAKERQDMSPGMAQDSANEGIRLSNIVYMTPIISGGQELGLNVEFSTGDTGAYDYKICGYSDSGPEMVTHSQGNAEFFSATDVYQLDLKAVKRDCGDRLIKPQECYGIFHAMSFAHGPCYQSLQSIYIGQGQALGQLMLSDSFMNTKNDYVLHPSIMDGALQVSLLMTMGLPQGDVAALRTPLPFVMKQIEVYKPCTTRMWAYVRYADGSAATDKIQKFDIDLCDEQGIVCISIKAFSTMFWEGDSNAASQAPAHVGDPGLYTPSLYFSPQWISTKSGNHGALQTAFKGQRLVVLCEPREGVLNRFNNDQAIEGIRSDNVLIMQEADASEDNLETIFIGRAVALMERIKRMVRDNGRANLLVQVVVFRDYENATAQSTGVFSALSGLLKSAAVEYPNLTGQIIELASGDDRLEAILEECVLSPNDTFVRYNASGRQVRRLTPVQAAGFKIPWKTKGVYLITGGAGGLGHIFADEIARNIKGARLYLSGRSEPNEAPQKTLEALQGLEAQVTYIKMDVTDPLDVTQAIGDIVKECGGLNGVIHSAGIIMDNYLVNKSGDEASSVLAPKVKGVINLDNATKSMDLDFMAFFSSMTANFGNIGQADYATANAFLDEYSEYRNTLVSRGERKGITVSINWPLWAEGGMRVSPEVEERMHNRMGVVPLTTDKGIEAFYNALALRTNRLLVMPGDVDRINDFVLSDTRPVSRPVNETTATETNASLLPLVRKMLVKMASEVLKESEGAIKEGVEFSQFGFDSIMLTAFSNTLNKNLKLDLSPTVFFEYTTIKALVPHLIESYHDQLVGYFGKDAVGPEGSKADSKPRTAIKAPSYMSVTHVATKSRQVNESIAIVGMSGSFPNASNVEEFWDNIVEGRNCISEVPSSRWDWREFWGDPRSGPNHTRVKWGGFLDGVDQFDPLFFGIAPSEAELMDPQQRLLLTEVWRALEDGGITPSMLTRDTTGVFMACGPNEYMSVVDLPNNNPLTLTSAFPSLIPNRISYLLDLKGPSEYCDTACSSSLLAVHKAIKSMQRGECSQAIVGAVNLLLSPDTFIGFDAMGYLSVDGESRSFQDQSGGYVRSEAVGAVILKPLSQALKDGNVIHAVIKGTGVAHGGKGMSLTTPSVSGMKSAMLEAYRAADIDPGSVSYIEAHGSAVPLADGLEVNALKAGLKEGKRGDATNQEKDGPVYVSSLKPCIGHGELAAGMSALIKVIMAIKHKVIPGVPGLETVNEHISLAGSPLKIEGTNHDWDSARSGAGTWPRRASINSYGFGGVSVHAVVEEYVPTQKDNEPLSAPETDADSTGQVPGIFVFSAKSQPQLRRAVDEMVEYLSRNHNAPLTDVAYTLQVGRVQHGERVAALADNRGALMGILKSYLKGETSLENCFVGTAQNNQVVAGFWQKYDGGHELITDLIERGEFAQVCHFWASGIDIDWSRLYQGANPARCSIPTYPFEKRRCWIDIPKLRSVTTGSAVPALQIADNASQKAANVSEDQLVSEYVTRSVTELLGLGKDEIDMAVALDKYGFDSIKQISLKHQMEYELDTEIPMSFFGMNDSLDKLISAISLGPSNGYIRDRILSVCRDIEPQEEREWEACSGNDGVEMSAC